MKIRSLFSLIALFLGVLATTSAVAKDYENFTISPGFASLSGMGLTGGSVSASHEYGSNCSDGGYIDKTPDHIIELTAEVDLTFTVSSDTDSTLVINGIGPGAAEYFTVCDDDSAGGLDAQITGTFPAGMYELYVGSYEEDESGRYTLHINEGLGAGIRSNRQAPASASRSNYPDSTQGHYGNFTIGAGFTPDPQTASGISGYSEEGRIDAATFGRQCTGFIDTTPDHTITITSNVNLRLTVSSEIDSVLVIRGPAGTFCDDDSAGDRDAQINALFTPGEYEVYVGNIGEAGEYILTVSESSQGGYVT